MAEKKTTKIDNAEVIRIENFFTRENEENGVWYEAVINGQPTGIEGLVLGANSTTAIVATNQWTKEIEEQKLIEDEAEKKVQYELSCAKRAAAVVQKLRGKNGKQLCFGEKTSLDKSDIEKIMLNSPALATCFLNFSGRNSNFLEGKKNS